MFKQNDFNYLSKTPFHLFGINFKDGFNILELSKHIKYFKNDIELEEELNKLMDFIFSGNRKISFHEFRMFPYIIHSEVDTAYDHAGYAFNYTSSDIYLIKFIRKSIRYVRGKYSKYSFFDVDFIIENIKKIDLTEQSILYMPIDEMLK